MYAQDRFCGALPWMLTVEEYCSSGEDRSASAHPRCMSSGARAVAKKDPKHIKETELGSLQRPIRQFRDSGWITRRMWMLLSCLVSAAAGLRWQCDGSEGRASLHYPNHTRRRPLRPAQCGRHPTAICASSVSVPSDPAAAAGSRLASSVGSVPQRLCPHHSRRTRRGREEAPVPVNTQAECGVATHAHSSWSKM